MNTRDSELIATDEPTIVTESLFDAIVVEDGQGDGRLSNSASTNESGWCEALS